MASPKLPDAEPVFGSGPADDPGYLRSLGTGTMLGQLRRTFLALVAAPLMILALMPFIVGGELGGAPWWTLAVPAVLALAAGPIASRSPGPMQAGLEPVAAAFAASASFRAAIFLRFALTEGVIVAGVPLAMVAESISPFLVAFALGYPLLIAKALPTRATVERLRTRLESGGAASELWPALLAPYRPY